MFEQHRFIKRAEQTREARNPTSHNKPRTT